MVNRELAPDLAHVRNPHITVMLHRVNLVMMMMIIIIIIIMFIFYSHGIIMFRIVFWDVLSCNIIKIPLKRRSTIILHDSTSQKTILNFIFAAVRTWNLRIIMVCIMQCVLTLPVNYVRRWQFSGVQCHVVSLKYTDVSSPWWWRQDTPKCISTRLHGPVTQKAINFILAAVWT
jgi:hypothetical protein